MDLQLSAVEIVLKVAGWFVGWFVLSGEPNFGRPPRFAMEHGAVLARTPCSLKTFVSW